MATGNKKDPSYVVLRLTLTPLYGNVKKVTAMHTFDNRIDARNFAAKKSMRASSSKFVVQRVTPGPISRKK